MNQEVSFLVEWCKKEKVLMLSPQISDGIFKGSLCTVILPDWVITTEQERRHRTARGEVVSYCCSEKPNKQITPDPPGKNIQFFPK